jgi:predicted exporter
MLTSVCGFVSLLPSGFPGLAQLGLYSIAGLIAGAAVTRFVLPRWLPRDLRMRDLTPLGRLLGRLTLKAAPVRPFLLLVPLVAGTILFLHRDTLWSRELSALSPVPKAEQALDDQTRADLGSPDGGFLVALSGPDRESVLRDAERVGGRLDELTDVGVIGGFLSPAQYLPSLAAQEQRRASLPSEGALRTRLAQALAGLPLRPERLEPFIHDVQAARSQPFITREDLAHTSLGAAVAALLFESGGRWHALLPLRSVPAETELACPPAAIKTGCIDLPRVQRAVAGEPGEPLVMAVQGEANKLYATYLNRAVGFSLAGFAAIVLLLFIVLRSAQRVLRVVAPLVLSVLAVAGGLALFGQRLTLLHVIGMLLIVAVSSNYALFFDRRTAEQGEGLTPGEGSLPLTLASLLVANVATVLTFGVLAFSSVPVLAALGSTVAPGTLLALIFAAVLARHPLEGSTDTHSLTLIESHAPRT